MSTANGLCDPVGQYLIVTQPHNHTQRHTQSMPHPHKLPDCTWSRCKSQAARRSRRLGTLATYTVTLPHSACFGDDDARGQK